MAVFLISRWSANSGASRTWRALRNAPCWDKAFAANKFLTVVPAIAGLWAIQSYLRAWGRAAAGRRSRLPAFFGERRAHAGQPLRRCHAPIVLLVKQIAAVGQNRKIVTWRQTELFAFKRKGAKRLLLRFIGIPHPLLQRAFIGIERNGDRMARLPRHEGLAQFPVAAGAIERHLDNRHRI